ncbi:MAG TPA: hypothetical protein VIH04_07915 [Nitrosarchaeum sp.]
MSGVCVGIAEKWLNSDIDWHKKGVRGGKKYLHAYFIDESGKFYTKRVTRSEAIKIRLHGIWKKRKFVCEVCQCQFLGLIKNKNDVPDCPNCK